MPAKPVKPMSELSVEELVGLTATAAITPAEFGAEMSRRVASAKSGTSKSFSVKADSPKGVFTISLPGMGMAIAPPCEALQSLVDNVEALRAALARHGEERKATRAAYKLTPEYAASSKAMFNAASEAKAAAKAAVS